MSRAPEGAVDALCSGETVEVSALARSVRVRRAAQELGGVDRLLEQIGEAFNLAADEPEEP